MAIVSQVKSFQASELRMLDRVERSVRERGFLVMESLWTKTVVRGYDGGSGHTSYRTTMYKREGEGTFLLEITVREDEISLVTFFAVSEQLLPRELGI